MNSWVTLINFSMAAAALMTMFIGLLSVLIDRSMDLWSRRFFRVFFAVLFLYACSNYISVLWRTLPEPFFALSPKHSLFFESLLSGMLIPLLTVYLLHCTGEDLRHSALLYWIFGLFALYAVLLTVTQFTRFIYYYTPDNVYHRGPWYPLLLVPSVLSMLTLLIALLRRRSRLSRRQFVAFLIYILLPLIGMLIQMAFYGLYTVVFGTTLAALFLYIFIQVDQVARRTRQQEEIARQHASIMVLVEKAQQVILDFSSYLRQNFAAIVKEETIPFTEELEHTRAYLAVEKARYEDTLFVDFDTPFTNFRLPPLTLQPIVENAVKHGLDPELEPLRITVQTRETEGGFRILVADNGPGYAPAADDEPHIALNNIRERLKLMCGGTLDIRPGEGAGTVVTVTVPDRPDTVGNL